MRPNSIGNYGIRSADSVGIVAAIAGETIHAVNSTIQIPSGQTSIAVEAIGRGQDGSPGVGLNGGAGGAGGNATLATVAVTPGEVLTINLDSHAELRRGATVLVRAPAGGSVEAGIPEITETGGAAGTPGVQGSGGGGGASGSGGGGTGGDAGGAGGAGAGMIGVGDGNGGAGGSGGAGGNGNAPGGGGGGGAGLVAGAGGIGGAGAMKIIWS